jgi:hypothetical protein
MQLTQRHKDFRKGRLSAFIPDRQRNNIQSFISGLLGVFMPLWQNDLFSGE